MIRIILIFAFGINFSVQTFVDLGHELSEDTPIFPNPGIMHYTFNLTALANETTPDGYWVAYNTFCSFEHIGTHVDAPYHFNEHGWTLEQIPFERLIAHAVVIDVTEKAALLANYPISIEDVDNWIAENGLFPNHSVILGRTGWSKKFQNPEEYFGNGENETVFHFPGFDVTSVNYIMNISETNDIDIVGFGTDTISLDYAPSNVLFEAHQAVQKKNKFIIENMNNLEALPLKGATLFVMPMKVRGGTGAPARIFAQLPDTEEDATLDDSDPLANSTVAVGEDVSDVSVIVPSDETSGSLSPSSRSLSPSSGSLSTSSGSLSTSSESFSTSSESFSTSSESFSTSSESLSPSSSYSSDEEEGEGEEVEREEENEEEEDDD